MSEIEIAHRYLEDNERNKFFPVTHIDALLGNFDAHVETFSLNSPCESNNAVEKGFACGYRTIDLKGLEIKTIYLNGTHIENEQVIAELSSDFDLPSETQIFGITTSKDMAKIIFNTDGTVIFHTSSKEWTSEDYIYGQFTWIE